MTNVYFIAQRHRGRVIHGPRASLECDNALYRRSWTTTTPLAVTLLLSLFALGAAIADEPLDQNRELDHYWSYSYQGIEIVGYAERQTVAIADDLYRLDKAAGKVFDLGGLDWRPPAFVFIVPHDQFQSMRGKNPKHPLLGEPWSSERLVTTGKSEVFGTYILIDAAEVKTSFARQVDAFYDWAGAVMLRGRMIRYPFWFQAGLQQLLAGAVTDAQSVRVGGASIQWRAFAPKRIPLQELLQLRSDERRLSDYDFSHTVSLECYALVHLLLIEQDHSTEFLQYLDRIKALGDENRAFTESFSESREELQAWFDSATKRKDQRILVLPISDDDHGSHARQLTSSEAAAALAQFTLDTGGNDVYAMHLAQAALSSDADDSLALGTLAAAQIRANQVGQGYANAIKLCAGSNRLAVSSTCGRLYATLARAAARRPTDLPQDAAALASQSRLYFDAALAQNGEDLQSWCQEAELLTMWPAVGDSTGFVQRANRTLYIHPHFSELARALAQLTSSMGDYVEAEDFAKVWKNNAPTSESREAALQFLTKLNSSIQPASSAQTAAQP